ALALVAVVATPLGAAIGRTFDDFSAWLTGEPGTKASDADQDGFDRANARSWTAFPPGTELRKLLVARAAGTDFTLYGFRSGESLCLRLPGQGAGPRTRGARVRRWLARVPEGAGRRRGAVVRAAARAARRDGAGPRGRDRLPLRGRDRRRERRRTGDTRRVA